MSQKNMILDWLKKGNSISPLEALEKFNCFRLGARISDIKKEGYKIQTVINTGKKKFARYFLIEEGATYVRG